MSYQYYDRGAPHGVPEYDRRPPPGRRPPPPGNYYPPSDRQRGPPPIRPPHTGGSSQGMRYPVRPPPPQQYEEPHMEESADSLYDGSAYGGAEYDEPETWPLPARPFAQSGRSNSPGGSPRGSPRQAPPPSHQPPVSNSPRRPPQRPQRPDDQEQIYDQRRPAPRVAPANKAYHQPPPPQQHPHHGPGQWTGDGYRSPQPPPPPPQNQSRPPPQSQPSSSTQYTSTTQSSSMTEYQMPQALQQTIYGSRNQRPPLGPPPSSRRGPPSYYPQIAQVHPIVEETDSMRASIRNASIATDPAHASYASSNAIPIGIPGYYVEDRGSARSLPFEQHGRPSVDHSRPSVDHGRPSVDHGRPSVDNGYDDLPIKPIQENADEGRYMYNGVDSPSPEPGNMIRQASLGKKSKPTLTTVKSSERSRKESAGYGAPPSARPSTTQTSSSSVLDKELFIPRRSVSSLSSDGDGDDKAFEAGTIPLPSVAALAVPSKAKTAPTRQWSAESGVLSSGAGHLGHADSDSEDERPIKKQSSRELLTAALPKEQLNRSQPRSPLAPPDPTAGPASLSRSANPTPTPSELEGPADRFAKKRPPRLDVDAVRDAEARGSLTSLPDLIRRATKVADRLDRGRTASRLGMNFFVDGADSSPNRASVNRKSGDVGDMLAAFPPPSGRFGSPPGSRGGVSLSRWSSNLRHSHLPSDSDAGEIRRRKKGRRCCGMPMWLFMVLLIVLLLLVAAAVLVPVILLIIIPGQQSDTSSTATSNASKAVDSCSAKLTCANGGTNMLSTDGFCQCVCTNGFTGSTCETKSNGCTTIAVGSTSDATVGKDLPRLLDGAERNFGIALDTKTLLGLFSSAEMQCADENKLVEFSTGGAQRRSASLAPRDGPVYSATFSNSTMDFAGVAVLYILQDSADPGTAVTAHTKLQHYFQDGKVEGGADVGKDVSLGNGYSCDLQNGVLRLPDASTVGP